MPCYEQFLLKQDEHVAWEAYKAAKDRNENAQELSRLADIASQASTRLREHLQVCMECKKSGST